jgi:hypothetical protein
MTTKWGINTDEADKAVYDAFDEINYNDSVTEKDIEFIISTIAKEAPHDIQSIKQIFYGMLSAFTKVVIHHTVSSKNSGAGKTYILVLVSGYFPKVYVIPLNGMSDKAMLYKAGIMVVEQEDGQLAPLDSLIGPLEIEQESTEDKKYAKELEGKIKDLKDRAEKLIVLENKIILLLDTTQDGMFNALMSMVSQDTKEDQRYEYVDTSSHIGTRSNRFRGVPAIFTCQVVDDSKNTRYAEKLRRFIHVIPNTSNEKIQTAVDQMSLNCGLTSEEYDDEVVSIEDKDRAHKICDKLVNKLKEHTKHLGPKESGIKIFFPLSISQSIPSGENEVWSMTVADRLFKYLAIITKVNMDSRPRVIDTITEKFYPVATFEDVRQALELMSTASSALRPYIIDWYNNVFLPAYNDLDRKASVLLDSKGNVIMKEIYVGVNTKQLSDKTAEIMGVSKANAKDILQQYLYPMWNLGIIDRVKSEIDRRGYIWYPVEQGNIHTLFTDPDDKRLEVFEPSFYPTKEYIEDNSRTFVKYSSEGTGVNDKRLKLVDPKGNNITVSELVDRYLYNPETAFKEPSKENNHNHDDNNDPTSPYPLKNNLTDSSNNVIEDGELLVNLHDKPRKQFHVYIGRQQRWGPPGKAEGDDGYFGNPYTEKEYGRDECLRLFEIYFYKRLIQDPEYFRRIHGLKDKVLACWCTPEPCHGDIILEYLNSVK